MKYFSAFIFCSTTFFLKAQINLVQNPSFETYTTCPTSSAQIYYAAPWTGPTVNSTDYYNSCSSVMTVPGNGVRYQYPRTGNAYAGFWGMDGKGANFREYLQVQLINNLINGKCYYIKFYINLLNGNSSTYVGAINNIAAHISNVAYTTTSSTGNVLSLIPHALKFGNPIVTDTLNWVEVSGIYNALGGEDYIIIGNFKNDAQTDTSANYYPIFTGQSYYLVDDVSVIPTDSMSIPPYAGNDTTIALGDSVFIGQQLYGLNCDWFVNGSQIAINTSGLYVKPTTTTTYVVEQNLCSNISYDTVTVNVSTVGIKKYSDKKDILVYPNPNSGKELFIAPVGISNGSLQIRVTDLEGRTIYENNCIVIDGLSNLKIIEIKNGVYFVHITNTSTGEKVVKKLVIQY